MKIEYINSLKSLTAIIPGYINNYGKITRIYLKNGSIKEVSFSFSKVLKDYCLINYLNLNEIRKLSGSITGSKGMVPIYIRKDRILISFKVYEKKGDNERTFGYINIKEINDLDLNNKFLTFKSGQKIKYFDKKENVIRKIGQGQLLWERIKL